MEYIKFTTFFFLVPHLKYLGHF